MYPHSLDTIYPATTITAVSTALSYPEKPSIIANKVASGHVRKPSWKRGLPPVPPLPKNVHALRPVSAVSGRPLSSARIGRGVTVQLPSLYPNICLCMSSIMRAGTLTDELRRSPGVSTPGHLSRGSGGGYEH